MSNLQFGAELQLTGQETATATEAKVSALRQSILELAQSYEAGEIGQQEFLSALKPMNADLRANEAAARIMAQATRELAQAQAQAAQAAEQWATEQHEAVAAVHDLAESNARAAAQHALEDQVEREVLAIQHETEMLRHEEAQLRAVKAAEDAEIASLERSVQADLAASNATEALTADRQADALALAKETDFERLDASVKKQEAQAARELADAEEDLAAAHRHEVEILGIRTTKTGQMDPRWSRSAGQPATGAWLRWKPLAVLKTFSTGSLVESTTSRL